MAIIEPREKIEQNIATWNIPRPTQKYKVVIHCSTYNHEKYIKDALNGFVMQKTTFPFCAIIIDDSSSDRTAEIIKEYAIEYPDIIKPICLGYNHMQHGLSRNPYFDEWHKASDYLAQCEGDDYWISNSKLQIMVDYLDNHSDCIYACHRYKIHDVITNTTKIAPNEYFEKNPNKEYFEFNQTYPFLHEWITKTLTCVYRNIPFEVLGYKDYKYARDTHFIYHILAHGKGVCFNFIGGVYTKNGNGIFGSLSQIKQDEINYYVFKELSQATHDPLMKFKREEFFNKSIYNKRYSVLKDLSDYTLYLKYIFRKLLDTTKLITFYTYRLLKIR